MGVNIAPPLMGETAREPARASTWGLLGLVRALDLEAGRHRYALGRLPLGELAGELASLRDAPGPRPVPVWIDEHGTLSTDRYRPPAAAAPLDTRARWALAPLGWGDALPAGRRLATAAARAARATHVPAPPDRAHPSRPPDGYLDAVPGPTTVPLYAGVHPVTGDQLVTTERLEIDDLGYADPVQLGHAIGVAYLTGRRGTERLPIPWASRLGRRVRAAGLQSQAPIGVIDGANPPGRLPTAVWGWALAPLGQVSRVDVELNGRPCGPARIGLPRADVAECFGLAHAHTCGFEFALLPSHVIDADRVDGRLELEVAATAHGYGGESHRLETLHLSLPASALADGLDPIEQTRAAELQARTRRRLPGPAPALDRASNALVFSHNLALGGAQLYLAELLARLCARPGFRASVVALGDGPLREQLEALGIPVHVTGQIALESAELYEARVGELAAWAAPEGFDVAIVNSLCAFPGVDVAGALGIPSLFAIHESYELDAFWGQAYGEDFAGPYARRRGHHALAAASVVIFEAEATRRLYQPQAADPDRHVTLPYAIEFAALDAFRALHGRDAARRELGFSAEDRVVLCLGTAEPRKAQSVLIDAFTTISPAHPDAVLTLVGLREDAYSDALREHATASGLGTRVRLVSLSSEPWLWLAAADVLVCASDVESLPRAILEAMAFELPVVSTAVYGVADLIEDGRTGYLCELRDGAALAAALDRALSASASERRAVGRAAGELVRREHDPDTYCTRVSLLLDEIVRQHARLPEAEDGLLAA